MTETAAPNAPGGGRDGRRARSGVDGGEPVQTPKQELVARQTGMELEEVERTARRDRTAATKEAEEASGAAWRAAAGTRERTAKDSAWPAWA